MWSTGDTTSTIEVFQAGDYSVVVTNEAGCSTSGTSTATNGCEASFVVPNAFSPNADGLNDVFTPVSFGNPIFYEMKIFNRWGEMIFKSDDFLQGWDGTISGKMQELGTYIWLLSFKDGLTPDEVQVLSGNVILLR